MNRRAACKIFKVSRCTLQNRFIGKGQPTKLEMAKKQNGQPSHQTRLAILLIEHILSNLERNIEGQSFQKKEELTAVTVEAWEFSI